MATNQEINEALGVAQLAIARHINAVSSQGGNPEHVLALAEAFAWLTAPGQPH